METAKEIQDILERTIVALQKVIALKNETIEDLQASRTILKATIDMQKETIAIYEKRAVRQAVQNAEKDCGHFKLDDTACPACEYASRH